MVHHLSSDSVLTGHRFYVAFSARNGKVSQGALSILSELPVVYVKVEDLPALVNDPSTCITGLFVQVANLWLHHRRYIRY